MMNRDQERRFDAINDELKEHGLPLMDEKTFLENEEKLTFFMKNFWLIRKLRVQQRNKETPKGEDVMRFGAIGKEYQDKFKCSSLQFIIDYNQFEPGIIAMLEGPRAMEKLKNEDLQKWEEHRKKMNAHEEISGAIDLANGLADTLRRIEEGKKEEKPKEPQNPVLPAGFKIVK